MKVLLPGEFGRPAAIEQQLFWMAPHVETRRFPNTDEFDPLRGGVRCNDDSPWAWTDDSFVYYERLEEMIQKFKPDMLICSLLDDSASGGLWEKYGSKMPTHCPPQAAARLESDRLYGKHVFKKCGIDVSETFKFESQEEALDWANEQCDDWFVVKTLGMPFHPAKICKGKEALLSGIREWPLVSYPISIEEFLSGYDIEWAAFINAPKDMLTHILTDMEYTAVYDGEWGPQTGEMAIHGMAGVPRRGREIHEKLWSWYKEVGYVGWCDSTFIYNPRTGRLAMIEAMTRLGSSQIENFLLLCGTPFHTIIRKMWEGTLKEEDFKWRTRHSLCAHKMYSGHRIDANVPWKSKFYGPWRKLMVPQPGAGGGLRWHVRQQANVSFTGEMATFGERYFSGVGSGQTFQDARVNAYSVLDAIEVPHGMYRGDLGFKWYDRKIRRQLGEAGLLPDWWEEEK